MPLNPTKPLVWLLEEATADVAALMHQIERTGAAVADVRRVTYTDALRDLPREGARGPLVAVVVFSVRNLKALAALIKGIKGPRPRLCFWPPRFEALAELRPHQRSAVPVSAVARHGGEAAALASSGFSPELIVRLDADVAAGHLQDRDEARPLRVGAAWYNMAPAQREGVTAEIARWLQSAPDRCEWHLLCLPGDEPSVEAMPGVRVSGLTPAAAAAEPLPFDAWLTDPWWPEALPRPAQAPVTIHLEPGGGPGGAAPDAWKARLQALMDLGGAETWHEDRLWAWQHQPVWRHLLGPDAEPGAPAPALAQPDLGPLAAERARWHAWLGEARAEWGRDGAPEAPADALAYHFWIYDYRVEASWALDLWGALPAAKNGERHALLMALNGLRLHHTGAAWLLKRLLGRTPGGRAREQARRLGRRFWLRFAAGHVGLLAGWIGTLWRCGRDPEADPLRHSQAVAEAVLAAANVKIVRRNEPAPAPGVPTIYLLSHRHGDLDPFLLLDVLPGHLAVVIGPRAQRWPLINRLAHASAFVLTGRERGVVIADAIAAVRARRALALYPEVTEPSYLGEGTPLRGGLVWIVQALERSQVIPVVLDDAFTLGPDGGTVDLFFGDPIACTPETGDELLHRVRAFFHRHVERLNALDAPAAPSVTALEAIVPEASPEKAAGLTE